MAILIDRVKIIVESSGTGNFQLGAAVPGYRGVEALVNGTVYRYAIENGSLYEMGNGTFLSAGNVIVRAPVLSSNGNAAVALPAGSQLVFTAFAEDYGSGAAAEAGAEAGAIAGAAAALEVAEQFSIPTKLAANITYYVRTDGNDANTGLTNSSSGAFATIQHAIDVIYGTLDLSGFTAFIVVGDGAYDETLLADGIALGAGSVNGAGIQIVGNTGAPANVVVGGTGTALTISNGAYIRVSGITFETTGSGFGWIVRDNAVLEHEDCVFGDIANEMIVSQFGGIIRALGPLDVVGDAVSFVHAIEASLVDFSNQTITFSNNTFSQYMWGINNAQVILDSATIIGTVDGQISVHNNAFLNANLASGVWTSRGHIPEMNGGGFIAQQGLMQYRQFFVRPGGDDANSGLINDDAHAFKTIRGAINRIASFPFEPTMYSDDPIEIHVANGTYGETIPLRDFPYIGAVIIGDETTPSNVTIAGVTDAIIANALAMPWTIAGVTITASAGSALRVQQGSQVSYRNVRFGTCADAHIWGVTSARLIATGDYAIIGAAAWHFYLNENVTLDIASTVGTVTGTPAFSQAFAWAETLSSVRAAGASFSGSATGKRYAAISNSVIDTNGGGANFFPGNVAGTTASGAQYL